MFVTVCQYHGGPLGPHFNDSIYYLLFKLGITNADNNNTNGGKLTWSGGSRHLRHWLPAGVRTSQRVHGSAHVAQAQHTPPAQRSAKKNAPIISDVLAHTGGALPRASVRRRAALKPLQPHTAGDE